MQSLRTKILVIAVALVVVSQIATLAMVLRTTRNNLLDEAVQSLDRSTVVLSGIASTQSGMAKIYIDALVNDLAIKQAVANQNAATIQAKLREITDRPGAEFAVMYDRNYQVLTATGALEKTNEQITEVVGRSIRQTAGNTILNLDGQAYFVITAPVNDPDPIAWISVAYLFSDRYISRVQELLDLEISLFAVYSTGPKLLVSSLPPETHAQITQRFASSLDRQDLLEPAPITIYGTEYLAVRKPYLRNQQLMQVMVTLPMEEALATYSLIHRATVFLNALTLSIALLAAFLMSRALTRPIDELAKAAKRIQIGDYDQTISIDSADELGALASAFNAMQQEISAREQRIAHQAKHDGLTGLYNREFAMESLGAAIKQAAVDNGHVAVMVVSLNARQELSGTLGHEVADAYLNEAAAQVRTLLHADFVVARLELDTFMVILANSDSEGAKQTAQDLIDRLATGIHLPDISVAVNPCVGIAVYPDHGDSRERLMLRATIAKSEGNSNLRPVSIYREGDEEQRARNMTLLQDLRDAVANNNLTMHYQPKINVADESVCGVEGLARWDHPTYGWLQPSDFIHVIEQSGNISILTRWALETIAEQYLQWAQQGLDLQISVNLSAHDLQDRELPWFLMDILRAKKLPPEKLTVEITEQAMVQDFHRATTVLTRLRDLGIRISLDDFGTGYSSLSQLKKLPVDELKIDRSFVARLPNDRSDAAIVSSAIELAHKLKLGTVAEGVSSGAAYRWLQEHGIDQAQGFYWSKALPADEFCEWVNNYSGGSTRFVTALEVTGITATLETVED